MISVLRKLEEARVLRYQQWKRAGVGSLKEARDLSVQRAAERVIGVNHGRFVQDEALKVLERNAKKINKEEFKRLYKEEYNLLNTVNLKKIK